MLNGGEVGCRGVDVLRIIDSEERKRPLRWAGPAGQAQVQATGLRLEMERRRNQLKFSVWFFGLVPHCQDLVADKPA